MDMFKYNPSIMFANTDWDDYLFRKLSWQTQHNITVSEYKVKYLFRRLSLSRRHAQEF